VSGVDLAPTSRAAGRLAVVRGDKVAGHVRLTSSLSPSPAARGWFGAVRGDKVRVVAL